LLFGFGDLLTIGINGVGQFQMGGHGHDGLTWLSDVFLSIYTYIVIALVFVAIFLARAMYRKMTLDPGKFNKDGNSFLYKALSNRWWFPVLYNQIGWKLGDNVAKGVDFVDTQIVDGTVNALSAAVAGGGDSIGKMQSGNIRDYSTFIVLGVVLLFAVIIALFYFMGGE
jgi:NADH-quinone oxidoreductase subunit L